MVRAVATNLQRRQHHTIPSPSHTPHFTQSYTHTTRHDMMRQQQYTIPLGNMLSKSGWSSICKCTVKILELSFPTFLNADLVCFCLLQFYTLSFVLVSIFLLHKRNLEESVHLYNYITNALKLAEYDLSA